MLNGDEDTGQAGNEMFGRSLAVVVGFQLRTHR